MNKKIEYVSPQYSEQKTTRKYLIARMNIAKDTILGKIL